MLAVLEERPEDRGAFRTHVAGGKMWLIATDFCVSDPGFPNDVFAYTLYPADGALVGVLSEAAVRLPRDLKDTAVVTPDMLAYLRDPRWFSIVFAVDRSRVLFKGVEAAREAVDSSLALVARSPYAADLKDDIDRVRGLRQEMQANAFNVRLVENMVLAALFAAVVGCKLVRHAGTGFVAWMPDRDAITMGWQQVAYTMFCRDLNGMCQRHGISLANTQLGLGHHGPRPDGKRGMWYDELIRIPDFLAGAIAEAPMVSGPLSVRRTKVQSVFSGAIIDNPKVIGVALDASLPERRLVAERVLFSSDPSGRSPQPAQTG